MTVIPTDLFRTEAVPATEQAPSVDRSSEAMVRLRNPFDPAPASIIPGPASAVAPGR